MKVRIIPKRSLPQALNEPWVDSSKRPYLKDETAYVPVKEGFSFDEELTKRRPYLGRGYQKLGDTILLHGRMPDRDEIEEILAWENPSCILYAESHDGVMRLPKIETIFGSPHEVTFVENKIRYTLDPSKVMFSQGNREEKMRLKKLVKPNEKICDMFAGIGYFSLSAAAAGAEFVHAIEINPESYKFLVKNISANNFSNIFAEQGDCREKISGTYDRILMGHFDAPDFLMTALAHADSGTVIHVHGVGDQKKRIEETLQVAGFTYSLTEYKVKKYAPSVWHSVWDVIII